MTDPPDTTALRSPFPPVGDYALTPTGRIVVRDVLLIGPWHHDGAQRSRTLPRPLGSTGWPAASSPTALIDAVMHVIEAERVAEADVLGTLP